MPLTRATSCSLALSVHGVQMDQTKSGLSMLPKEAIEEYKTIYKAHFGAELSDEEASFRANNLMNLYKAVLLPSSIGAIKLPECKS